MQLILLKDNANRAENIQVYLKCLTEMQLILSKDNANRAENIQVYLKCLTEKRKAYVRASLPCIRYKRKMLMKH